MSSLRVPHDWKAIMKVVYEAFEGPALPLPSFPYKTQPHPQACSAVKSFTSEIASLCVSLLSSTWTWTSFQPGLKNKSCCWGIATLQFTDFGLLHLLKFVGSHIKPQISLGWSFLVGLDGKTTSSCYLWRVDEVTPSSIVSKNVTMLWLAACCKIYLLSQHVFKGIFIYYRNTCHNSIGMTLQHLFWC